MKQIFVIGQKNSGIKEIGKHLKDWGIKEIEMDDLSKKMLEYIRDNSNEKKFTTLAKLERKFADKIKEKIKGDFFIADDWSIKTHRIYKRYCDPIFIIMFRNPIDLAKELEKQTGNFEQALNLITQEDALLMESLKLLGEDRIYISYDEYLRDKERVLKNIKEFI